MYETTQHHQQQQQQQQQREKEYASNRARMQLLEDKIQKMKEQIDEIAQLQSKVEQLLIEQKEQQDHWKRLETELYLLKKEASKNHENQNE